MEDFERELPKAMAQTQGPVGQMMWWGGTIGRGSPPEELLVTSRIPQPRWTACTLPDRAAPSPSRLVCLCARAPGLPQGRRTDAVV